MHPVAHTTVFLLVFICTNIYFDLKGLKSTYTEPQKKRRNFNNSIKYGKQSIYFFSLTLSQTSPGF